jgi:hypothetical protein
MPSYRASVAVIETLPGVPAAAVLETARAGVAAHCHVEDALVDVDALTRGGLPRVTIRFVVPTSNDSQEDLNAWATGKALAVEVSQVARWQDLRVLRRVKGRWVPLRHQT